MRRTLHKLYAWYSTGKDGLCSNEEGYDKWGRNMQKKWKAWTTKGRLSTLKWRARRREKEKKRSYAQN